MANGSFSSHSFSHSPLLCYSLFQSILEPGRCCSLQLLLLHQTNLPHKLITTSLCSSFPFPFFFSSSSDGLSGWTIGRPLSGQLKSERESEGGKWKGNEEERERERVESSFEKRALGKKVSETCIKDLIN